MLRPWSSGRRSPLGFAGDPVPCVQCERREVGLAWGDYCSVCRAERERRANRVARRVGIAGAAVLAGWLIWRTPNEFVPRLFAAASVLLLYVVLRRVAARVALELMGNRAVGGSGGVRSGGPPASPGGQDVAEPSDAKGEPRE